MQRGIDKLVVLKTAAQIADENSLEKLSLAEVAKRLEIKAPSLYNHVQGLQGLKKDLAIYGLSCLGQVLTEASIGLAGRDAIYSIGIAYVNFVRKHPGLYEATFRSSNLPDPELQDQEQRIVNILIKVLSNYDFEPNYVLHTVRGLRSLVHGFASLELKKGFNLDLDPDESLKLLLNTYLIGLATNHLAIYNVQ